MFKLRRRLRVATTLALFIPAMSQSVCGFLSCCSLGSVMTGQDGRATHDHSSHCAAAIDLERCSSVVLSDGDETCLCQGEAVKLFGADYIMPSVMKLAVDSPPAAVYIAKDSPNVLYLAPELLPPRT